MRTDFKPSEFIVVPAGTEQATCKGSRCERPIYWVRLARTGRPHPVDCDVKGGEFPSVTAADPAQTGLFDDPAHVDEPHDGRGVSHFETCVDAGAFRGHP